MTKGVRTRVIGLAAAGLWLLQAAFVPAQTPPVAAGTPASNLPPAQEIIARHIKAAGGEAAFRALKSIHITGTFELTAQAAAGPFEAFSARPAKIRTIVDLAAVGRIENGYDGKNAWEIAPVSGPAVLKGRQAAEMADDAWFDAIFHEPALVKDMVTVSKEEFERKIVYKVQVTFVSGNQEFQYFDVETGLQVGSEGTRETPMGVLPQISVLRDYQKYGEILMATTLSTRTMGFEQVVRVKTVELNKVPDTAFDPPPAVKALIK